MSRMLSADQAMVGDEPIGASIHHDNSSYNEDIARALNWYSYMKNNADAKKYMIAYMKKNPDFTKDQIGHAQKIHEKKYNSSMCWILRMTSNGAVVKPHQLDKALQHITFIVQQVEETEQPKESTEVKKSNIQDALQVKIIDHLGELDGLLDDHLHFGKPLDMYSHLKSHQVAQPYIRPTLEWIQKKIPEIEEAVNGDDKLLKEGYSNFTPSKLKKYLKDLKQFEEDCIRYGNFKKANRKPTVRKPKPAGVQVAKLKFKKEDEAFKLNSIHPTSIIGAEQLWVFNTKNKKLGVYYASGPAGLAVKNSTVINFDPETSVCKTLRKPEETLQKCLTGGKLVMRKLLAELSTKDAPMNGRISADMILVKVSN